MRYRVFKRGLLLIHLGGHRLIVLIDNYKWQNNRLYSAGLPIIQPVIIRYMHDKMCEPIMDSRLPEVTWGHSCTSRAHVPGLEKPLWLVCIHCVSRAYTSMLEKFLWFFGSISVSSPGLHWPVSGAEFRDQLETFLAFSCLTSYLTESVD